MSNATLPKLWGIFTNSITFLGLENKILKFLPGCRNLLDMRISNWSSIWHPILPKSVCSGWSSLSLKPSLQHRRTLCWEESYKSHNGRQSSQGGYCDSPWGYSFRLTNKVDKYYAKWANDIFFIKGLWDLYIQYMARYRLTSKRII